MDSLAHRENLNTRQPRSQGLSVSPARIYGLLIAFRTTYTTRNQEFQSLLANASWHSRRQKSQSEMFGKII